MDVGDKQSFDDDFMQKSFKVCLCYDWILSEGKQQGREQQQTQHHKYGPSVDESLTGGAVEPPA
jgi:hypothetical protein